MLNSKQKRLLANWIEKAKHKIIGADDLTIKQYQELTDVKDFDGFEKEVNDYIHNERLLRDFFANNK